MADVSSEQYVYAVWPVLPGLSLVKVGSWSGTLAKLRSRYVTVYGGSLGLLVFATDNALAAERKAQQALLPFHLENELFHHSCLAVAPAVLSEASGCDSVQWGKCVPRSSRPPTFTQPPPTAENVDVEQLLAQTEANQHVEYRRRYKRAWGLRLITREFVASVGTKISCDKADVIRAVLDPTHPDWCITADVRLRAEHVREILTALGLKGPFDTETVVTSLEPLKDTHVFRAWRHASRVFDRRAKPKDEWDAKALADATRTVLGAAGLCLHAVTKKPRGPDGKQRRVRNWTLDADAVAKMSDLVALREGKGATTRWAAIAAAPVDI